MMRSSFDSFVGELDAKCKEIIESKRPEYTDGLVDVLTNFKKTAAEVGVSPLQVAYIFFRKHVASIGQHCAGKHPSSEPIINRLADARNYIDIIWALTNEPNA